MLCHQQAQLSGTVRFIFQHAEEVPLGGAREPIKHGVLNGVEKIFGLHVMPNFPTGQVGLTEGVFSAASNNFDLIIQGKDSHAALPQESVDPVVLTSGVVQTLHSFIANGGYNVIPDSAHLRGTLRTLSNRARTEIP